MATAFPAASAGAAFQIGIATGKFQGVIKPATPCGLRSERSSAGSRVGSELPSGSSAAAPKYSRIAIARAHSPRASVKGLCTSLTIESINRDSSALNSFAAAKSALARVVGLDAHAIWALRAASIVAFIYTRNPSGNGSLLSRTQVDSPITQARPVIVGTIASKLPTFVRSLIRPSNIEPIHDSLIRTSSSLN